MISSFMSELWEMKVPSAVQSTGADSPTITSSEQCYNVLQRVTMCYNVLQCVTMCYNVLQCHTCHQDDVLRLQSEQLQDVEDVRYGGQH